MLATVIQARDESYLRCCNKRWNANEGWEVITLGILGDVIKYFGISSLFKRFE